MIMKIKNDVICACALWGDVVPFYNRSAVLLVSMHAVYSIILIINTSCSLEMYLT